jgi:hypothetical protein
MALCRTSGAHNLNQLQPRAFAPELDYFAPARGSWFLLPFTQASRPGLNNFAPAASVNPVLTHTLSGLKIYLAIAKKIRYYLSGYSAARLKAPVRPGGILERSLTN